MALPTKPLLVYFDDHCLVCNGFVQFILKQDRGRGRFRLAALAGGSGQALAAEIRERIGDQETIVVVRGEERLLQSAAVLAILWELGGAWRLAYAFTLIPPFIRNFLYQQFSINRFRFGDQPLQCMLPPPEYRKYFVE